ncbi:unnamed protein product, partial [Tenebrio molitor]
FPDWWYCSSRFFLERRNSPTVTKCDKRKIDFNDCLSGAIKKTITQLDKPLKEYNLPSFEPLFLPMFLPKTGTKNNFHAKFKNYRIFGHTKITDLKATMNFENKTLTITITNPEVRYELDYEAKGVMFLLPIDASGPALVIGQNVQYTLNFTFEEYTKDNQDYLLVIESKLDSHPESLKFHFGNLFKDEILNDGFNREINQNWKTVFEQFKAIYFDSYAQGYGNVLNNFLGKVPLIDLFDGV